MISCRVSHASSRYSPIAPMPSVRSVALMLVGTAALLSPSTCNAEHSVSKALGLSHCHGGMTEFYYVQPGNASLAKLRKQLVGTGAEKWIGPAETFENFQPVFGVSCQELESITLARPWIYSGIRPFLVVGRTANQVRRMRSGRDTKLEKYDGREYLTWKNDLAFATAGPDAVLHGTISEIRQSGGGPYDVCGPHVPEWEEFHSPVAFRLSLGKETDMVLSMAKGVNFFEGGFEIISIHTYHPTTSVEFLERLLDSHRKESRSLARVADTGLGANYRYSNRLDEHRIHQKIRFENLTTAQQWKAASHSLRYFLEMFTFMEPNYWDYTQARDHALYQHKLLLDGGLEPSASKRAAQLTCASLARLARMMTQRDCEAIKDIYLDTMQPDIVECVGVNLRNGFSPAAVILNDRLGAADASLPPTLDKILTYYALFGEAEVSSAAIRMVGRRKIFGLRECVRSVAFDRSRSEAMRAVANASLAQLGLPVDPTVDTSKQPAFVPLNKKNAVAGKTLITPTPSPAPPTSISGDPQKGTPTPIAQKSLVPEPPKSRAEPSIDRSTNRGARRQPTRSQPTRGQTTTGRDKIDKYLNDLLDHSASRGSHQAALHHLAQMDLPATMRDRVFDIVTPYVTAPSISLSVNAFKILGNFGFEEDDDAILIEAFNNLPQQASKAMAAQPTPRILAFLETRIQQATRITDPTFRAMEAIGSDAEEHVWPGLDNEQAGIRSMCLRVLSNIGTQRTIEMLTDRTDLPERTIQQTIARIRDRERR